MPLDEAHHLGFNLNGGMANAKGGHPCDRLCWSERDKTCFDPSITLVAVFVISPCRSGQIDQNEGAYEVAKADRRYQLRHSNILQRSFLSPTFCGIGSVIAAAFDEYRCRAFWHDAP